MQPWFASVGLPAGPQYTACCRRDAPHLLQFTGVTQKLRIPVKEREKSHPSSFVSLALMSLVPRFGENGGVLIKAMEKRQGAIKKLHGLAEMGDGGLGSQEASTPQTRKREQNTSSRANLVCV